MIFLIHLCLFLFFANSLFKYDTFRITLKLLFWELRVVLGNHCHCSLKCHLWLINLPCMTLSILQVFICYNVMAFLFCRINIEIDKTKQLRGLECRCICVMLPEISVKKCMLQNTVIRLDKSHYIVKDKSFEKPSFNIIWESKCYFGKNMLFSYLTSC